jgi:hypothetical protein
LGEALGLAEGDADGLGDGSALGLADGLGLALGDGLGPGQPPGGAGMISFGWPPWPLKPLRLTSINTYGFDADPVAWQIKILRGADDGLGLGDGTTLGDGCGDGEGDGCGVQLPGLVNVFDPVHFSPFAQLTQPLTVWVVWPAVHVHDFGSTPMLVIVLTDSLGVIAAVPPAHSTVPVMLPLHAKACKGVASDAVASVRNKATTIVTRTNRFCEDFLSPLPIDRIMPSLGFCTHNQLRDA